MSDLEKSDSKPKSKLDEDTLSYFKRVETVIEDDDFDDEESKQLFVENVFTQIEDNEVALSCDQALSRVLEKLIEYFNDAQVKIMWKNLSKDFNTVTTDCYGSHVIQHLVNSTPKTIRTERNKIKEVKRNELELDSMEQLFSNYCSFVSDNLQGLVKDTYGCHVVRAVFEVLGGVRVVDSVQRSRYSRGCRTKAFNMEEGKYGKVQSVGQAFGNTQLITPTQSVAVPESFISILKGLTTMFMDMDLSKLVFSRLSCPVLQTLLLVLHEKDAKLCSKLCKKIMSQVEFDKIEDSTTNEEDDKDDVDNKDDDDNKDDGDDKDDDDDRDSKKSYRIPTLFTHDVGSHLVEKILHVVSPKQHKKFFKQFFKGHLSVLSLHGVSNYILQHLLASTTDPTLAEQMLDELLGEIEEIFSTGHDGVIARMAELCVRLEVKQQEFQQAILKAFHCAGKKERKKCATLIFCMTTYDIFFGDEENEEDVKEEKEEEKKKKIQIEKSPQSLKRINFHGAVLLKTVLDFNKPKVFVNSIVNMNTEELVRVCKDFIGSRTVEALLKSKTVKNDKKNQLCDVLKGEFSLLACDKSASHVVETCWREVDTIHQELIAKELANEEHKLTKDFYGSKVLKNCGVEKFKRNAKDWKEIEARATRKRQNFEEFLQDSEAKKSKGEGEKKRKSDVVQKYASEMAVLGFGQTDEDNNNKSNVFKKESVKTEKPKSKIDIDDIDIIFKSKKLPNTSKTTTTNGQQQHQQTEAGKNKTSKKEKKRR